MNELSASDEATLVLQDDSADIEPTLARLEGVRTIRQLRSADDFPAYRISGAADITPRIFAAARERDWKLRELRRDTVTLESFFNQLATRA